MASKKTYDDYIRSSGNNFTSNIEENYNKFREKFFAEYKGNTNKRYLEFCEIGDNNPDDDIFELWSIYTNEKSVKKKKEIRFGVDAANDYVEKLKNRPVYKNRLNFYDVKEVSAFYGITEEEASLQIQNRKKNASVSISKSHNLKKQNNFDYRSISPMCREYWSDEEDHLYYYNKNRVRNDLDSFRERFGEDAMYHYNVYIEKRKKTNLEKYGRAVPPSLSHSSKEANSFFSKLLEVIGDKDHYHYGFGGKREYFLYDENEERSFSYDFVDSKNKIIVEYNGSFWHPRDGVVFKGIINEVDARLKDVDKKNLAERNGFSYMVVWDDEADCMFDNVVRFLKGDGGDGA